VDLIYKMLGLTANATGVDTLIWQVDQLADMQKW
jgi:hypothetical protein